MTRDAESKLYTLQVQRDTDNILVIEINSCLGSYDDSISDVLENAGSSTNEKDLDIFDNYKNGKTSYFWLILIQEIFISLFDKSIVFFTRNALSSK